MIIHPHFSICKGLSYLVTLKQRENINKVIKGKIRVKRKKIKNNCFYSEANIFVSLINLAKISFALYFCQILLKW